jgi:hypothetical protein
MASKFGAGASSPAVGSRPITHDQLDGACSIRSHLVLPHADYVPASRSERGIVPAIPLDVSIQLDRPVRRVSARIGPVIRTSVPEAAVDEHRDSSCRKDHVGPAAQPGNRRRVLAEAKTATVQLRTQCYLRPGLAGSVALHDPPHG